MRVTSVFHRMLANLIWIAGLHQPTPSLQLCNALSILLSHSTRKQESGCENNGPLASRTLWRGALAPPSLHARSWSRLDSRFWLCRERVSTIRVAPAAAPASKGRQEACGTRHDAPRRTTTTTSTTSAGGLRPVLSGHHRFSHLSTECPGDGTPSHPSRARARGLVRASALWPCGVPGGTRSLRMIGQSGARHRSPPATYGPSDVALPSMSEGPPPFRPLRDLLAHPPCARPHRPAALEQQCFNQGRPPRLSLLPLLLPQWRA